jgi:hypothetical protein
MRVRIYLYSETTKPVFRSSILGIYSKECIPAKMHSQECILLKIVHLVKY